MGSRFRFGSCCRMKGRRSPSSAMSSTIPISNSAFVIYSLVSLGLCLYSCQTVLNADTFTRTFYSNRVALLLRKKKKKSFLKFHRLVVILIGAKGDIRTTQVWTLAKVLWYYHTCKCVGINKRKGPTDTSISDESYIGQNNRKYFQRRYSTLNGDRNKKSTRKWNVSKNG